MKNKQMIEEEQTNYDADTEMCYERPQEPLSYNRVVVADYCNESVFVIPRDIELEKVEKYWVKNDVLLIQYEDGVIVRIEPHISTMDKYHWYAVNTRQEEKATYLDDESE